MNNRVLHTLEYDKIINHLADFAQSEAGKDMAKALVPSASIKSIIPALKNTGDALQRLIKDGELSFLGITDVSGFIPRLSIGASLNAYELLAVASNLEITARAKSYGIKQEPRMDSLHRRFEMLEPFSSLKTEIKRCIISPDEIASEASSELSAVRRSIGRMDARIHEKLQQLLHSCSEYLQDSVITQRDGRYTLPVRSEFKSKVSGIVHGTSATGATLYIEPAAIVDLNNEAAQLKHREQVEIEKVLSRLSGEVAECIEIISENFNILSELDFIFAKGRLALEHNATEPRFNTKGIIRLKGARHPMLDPSSVVPIDVSLGEDFNQLIITGPNTGGKTVSLKTVGLLSLMGQAGLYIPTRDRSKLSVFKEIYADIGDEQSIEQSLSTFSSHMTNIVKILKKAEAYPKGVLVFFDELCAGTDPSEGAALAEAILKHLLELGVRTMATTHYSELKLYALSTDSVENASCEFDVASLSPTYRLLIGIPGKSNAFAISKRLGLSERLIDEAAKNMSESERSFEDLLVDLEERRLSLERQREDIETSRINLRRKEDELKAKKQKLENSRDRILTDANEKAANILRDAKQNADAAIRNIRKYGDTSDMSKVEAQRQKLGQQLKTREQKTTPKMTQAPAKKLDVSKLKIGDAVHVISLNMDGTVTSLPDRKNKVEVQMGILQSKVNINDLSPAQSAPANDNPTQKTPGKRRGLSKAATISSEVMLIGKTADEAIMALDKYLDDAMLAGLSEVRIVHGKGSGILRKAVADHLRRLPFVKGYHLAEFGEGDTGVTIAEL